MNQQTAIAEETLFTIPAEPILIHRNQEKITKFQEFTKAAAASLSACLETYREIGLGELTLEELNNLYRKADTVDNFIREKVTGGQPQKIGGLVFSAEKVKEMVEVPDYSEFEEALAQLAGIDKKYSQPYQGQHYLNLKDFEVIHGEAVLKEQVMESYVQQQSDYAETDAEKEMYLLLEDMHRKIKYANDRYGVKLAPYDPHNRHQITFQETSYGYDSTKTTFKTDRIKPYLNSLFKPSRY